MTVQQDTITISYGILISCWSLIITFLTIKTILVSTVDNITETINTNKYSKKKVRFVSSTTEQQSDDSISENESSCDDNLTSDKEKYNEKDYDSQLIKKRKHTPNETSTQTPTSRSFITKITSCEQIDVTVTYMNDKVFITTKIDSVIDENNINVFDCESFNVKYVITGHNTNGFIKTTVNEDYMSVDGGEVKNKE